MHITVANGKKLKIEAVGTVRLKLKDANGKTHDYILDNVVYSPYFSHNLLSVKRLWKEHRLKTTFGATNYFKDMHHHRRMKFDIGPDFTLPQQAHAFTARKVIDP